jgi:hypothetical protein
MIRLFACFMSGVLRAPRTPCGRVDDPAPASDGVAVLAWVDDGVRRYMTMVASFVLSNNIYALSLLSDATPFARLRAAVFRKDRISLQTVCAIIYGRFCGTFFAAPARFFTSAQVFAPSRPAKGCSPFDPRQGAPCTCPASPFMAKPGFCAQRGFAEGAYPAQSGNLRVMKINSCLEQNLYFFDFFILTDII